MPTTGSEPTVWRSVRPSVVGDVSALEAAAARPPVGRCPVPGTVSGRTCFLGVRPAASSAAAPSEPRGRSSGCPCSPRWLGITPARARTWHLLRQPRLYFL